MTRLQTLELFHRQIREILDTLSGDEAWNANWKRVEEAWIETEERAQKEPHDPL